MSKGVSISVVCVLLGLGLQVACNLPSPTKSSDLRLLDTLPEHAFDGPTGYYRVKDSIRMREYHTFMASLVEKVDTALPYSVTEYILAAYNSWLIDTLAHTDYYWQMDHGKFVYDPGAMVILKPGDSLAIPSAWASQRIQKRLDETVLDLNIPAFELRILVRDTVRHVFPVRVGQRGKRYMEMAGREVDMRTVPGEGVIAGINKAPKFANPKDNKEYEVTRRDDQRVTLLPTAIPWLEPTINGVNVGQLIHPTTNPHTLGKAYSNGCIGVREGDMWRIYFHAPIGTNIHFRYDLAERDQHGHLFTYPDIYPGYRARLDTADAVRLPGWNPEDEKGYCTCVL